MCGIAALYNYRPGPVNGPEEVLRMREAMRERGPDGCGYWTNPDGSVQLAHRRLSIIDPSPAGAQPMLSRDQSLVLSFNGEIYNFRELRAELEQAGRCWQSAGDTEVLLALYAAEGAALVHRLRGMYAFALWDGLRKGLLLARDPLGIKPLYYADDGATLRAASQVKALLASGRIEDTPDPAGHVGFFLWGHVPSPHTLYRAIQSLPAGTTLWIDHTGTKTLTSFCSARSLLLDADHPGVPGSVGGGTGKPTLVRNLSSSPARGELIAAAFDDSVRHHLVADVPVGLFLSSGLDSASIATVAARRNRSLRTITLGFEEFKGGCQDETPEAEQIARRLGTRHHTVWVSRHDFETQRARFFATMDQPSIDGLNTYFVSLAASRLGLKAALSGVGADELLGGYPGFGGIPNAARWLAFTRQFPAFGKAFRVLSSPALRRLASPKYAGLFEYGGTYGGAYLLRRGLFMPWELPSVLDPELVRAGWRELEPLVRLEDTVHGLHSSHLRVSCLESSWYLQNQLLRDADWAGMAHAVEIRVPFVDVDLLRRLAPLAAGGTHAAKRDLAQCCAPDLPSILWRRPKRGFFVPIHQWLGAGARDDAPRHGGGARAWACYTYSQFVKN